MHTHDANACTHWLEYMHTYDASTCIQSYTCSHAHVHAHRRTHTHTCTRVRVCEHDCIKKDAGIWTILPDNGDQKSGRREHCGKKKTKHLVERAVYTINLAWQRRQKIYSHLCLAESQKQYPPACVRGCACVKLEIGVCMCDIVWPHTDTYTVTGTMRNTWHACTRARAYARIQFSPLPRNGSWAGNRELQKVALHLLCCKGLLDAATFCLGVSILCDGLGFRV
jgi:hypothetical protein